MRHRFQERGRDGAPRSAIQLRARQGLWFCHSSPLASCVQKVLFAACLGVAGLPWDAAVGGVLFGSSVSGLRLRGRGAGGRPGLLARPVARVLVARSTRGSPAAASEKALQPHVGGPSSAPSTGGADGGGKGVGGGSAGAQVKPEGTDAQAKSGGADAQAAADRADEIKQLEEDIAYVEAGAVRTLQLFSLLGFLKQCEGQAQGQAKPSEEETCLGKAGGGVIQLMMWVDGTLLHESTPIRGCIAATCGLMDVPVCVSLHWISLMSTWCFYKFAKTHCPVCLVGPSFESWSPLTKDAEELKADRWRKNWKADEIGDAEREKHCCVESLYYASRFGANFFLQYTSSRVGAWSVLKEDQLRAMKQKLLRLKEPGISGTDLDVRVPPNSDFFVWPQWASSLGVFIGMQAMIVCGKPPRDTPREGLLEQCYQSLRIDTQDYFLPVLCLELVPVCGFCVYREHANLQEGLEDPQRPGPLLRAKRSLGESGGVKNSHGGQPNRKKQTSSGKTEVTYKQWAAMFLPFLLVFHATSGFGMRTSAKMLHSNAGKGLARPEGESVSPRVRQQWENIATCVAPLVATSWFGPDFKTGRDTTDGLSWILEKISFTYCLAAGAGLFQCGIAYAVAEEQAKGSTSTGYEQFAVFANGLLSSIWIGSLVFYFAYTSGGRARRF